MQGACRRLLATFKAEIEMACPQLNLVLCSLPCYGHAKPLVILAEHLAEAGHQVRGEVGRELRMPVLGWYVRTLLSPSRARNEILRLCYA